MKCATCVGSGKFPYFTDICSVCEGRGELPDIRRDNPPCRVCNGTGKFPYLTDVCEVCGGWGRLPSEPAENRPLVIYVQAGTPRTTHLELVQLFENLQGELRICDPFYGTGSLHRLDFLTHCKTIRFLTRQADSKEKSFIDRAVKEFVSQHSNVEFRKINSDDLHDRYILTDDEVIILGHGFKDIGAKDSFVIRLCKEVCEDLLDTLRVSFDSKWAVALSLT